MKSYLVQTGGIEAGRLTTEGYGFDRPLAPNDTEEHMQKNRRTEVYIRNGDQQGAVVDTTSEPIELPDETEAQEDQDYIK